MITTFQISSVRESREQNKYKCFWCKDDYYMLPEDYKKMGGMSKKKKYCGKESCKDEMIAATLQDVRDKQKKESEQIRKKEREKLKEEINYKVKDSQQELQKAVNKIARLIDKGMPCLARPYEKNTAPLEGGHIFSTQSYPSLRYNIWNIHGQSHKSNCILGGETELMLEGISLRYGYEKRKEIEQLRITYRELHASKEQLRYALKEARRIIRDIERNESYYSRDEVNELLRLYR